MRGVRSHAKDYIISLDEQNDQFIDHFQGSHVAIESFIDVKEEESGDKCDFYPHNGDCFANFAQLRESFLQVNFLIRENVNNVNGINKGVMAYLEMLVAQGRRLGGLRARVV